MAKAVARFLSENPLKLPTIDTYMPFLCNITKCKEELGKHYTRYIYTIFLRRILYKKQRD